MKILENGIIQVELSDYAPSEIHKAEDLYSVLSKNGLPDCKNEHFFIVLMNGYTVKKVVDFASGEVNKCFFNVRELAKMLLKSDCNAFCVAHNHPSGWAAPSIDDDNVTKTIATMADSIGVSLVDHVIVTQSSYYSYLEHRSFYLKSSLKKTEFVAE